MSDTLYGPDATPGRRPKLCPCCDESPCLFDDIAKVQTVSREDHNPEVMEDTKMRQTITPNSREVFVDQDSVVRLADCEECGVILDATNDPHEFLECPGGALERVCVACLEHLSV